MEFGGGFLSFKVFLLTCVRECVLKIRVNKKIVDTKNSYFENVFRTYKNDVKKTWKTIKNLMGNLQPDTSVKELVINGLSYTKDEDIAESFNEFFTEIGSKLDSELEPSIHSPLKWMPPPRTSSFFLSNVTERECLRYISKFKNSKTNIDEMPVTILKKLSPFFITPLVFIINSCFKKSIFPSCLKIGRVIQIYKTGDRCEPSNYRPITTLPYLSKLFEMCLSVRLVKYFEKFSLLTELQFGFRKQRSTSDAVTEFCKLVYNSFDSKNYLGGVLIDFKKAFDTISHKILLDKLHNYGIRGFPLQLIRNYLCNRKQYVSFRDSVSTLRNVSVGLPQGSCLGPFLFLVYINDLPHVSSVLRYTLFADDTTLSHTSSNFHELISNLNIELGKVMEWATANRLTINATKTKVMLFSNKHIPDFDNSIKLGTQNLTIVSDSKFLGVHLDTKLNFDKHIDYITGKIARSTGIFFKIRGNLPLKARLGFYFGFIYPFLIYNVTVWGGTYNCYLSNLIVQHKRIIRAIADAGFNAHTSPIFFNLKLLKFVDIYKYFVSIFMYANLSKFSIQHSLNTRQHNLASSIFCRLTKTQQSIMFRGPQIWNELPLEIRDSPTLPVFKRVLKNYLISQYEE